MLGVTDSVLERNKGDIATTLLVAEIFGPTIAGEGSIIGQPTMFVRLAGCEYRCHFCDSMFAVDTANKKHWQRMSVESIADELDRLLSVSVFADLDKDDAHFGDPMLVSLSGGNPALHDCEGLVSALHDRGYRINVETQGTKFPEWLRMCDVVTLSPKPPSSGHSLDFKAFADAASELEHHTSAVIKMPVSNAHDLAFAHEVDASLEGNFEIYIQPVNEQSPEASAADEDYEQEEHVMALLEKLRWVTDQVLKSPDCAHWRILPQLHVLMYGNQRGK